MAKLFISYSRKDSQTARKLIQALRDIGQEVWVDWEDIPPAVDWLEQIFLGIEGSDAFIFLVSPHSIISEVCNVEVGRAAQNNKRIIPVVLQEVDPKTTNEIIRKLNWTFIREADDFDEGVLKVKTAIELDLDWLTEHNRLQSRALEWHRKKEPSLLLHGKDLRNAREMVMLAGTKDPIPTVLQKTFIHHSSQNDRRRTTLWVSVALALVTMTFLSYVAITQSRLATQNAIIAQQNELIAEESAEKARNNEKAARQAQLEAEEARANAEENKKIAEAQRSVARAQIYQSRPGELYTSTLLAIDSWQGAPSPEAEEILRENISLLPIPVAQLTQLGKINSLELNSDGDAFVTASADGTACVWNVEDGKNLFCATSSGAVNDAVFSPNGELIVTGDDTGLVQIINAETGEVQNKYNFGEIVWDVNIRPDGRLLAVTRDDGNNGKITFIDLITRKESFSLQAEGTLKVSSFSPNGLKFAAGSDSGVVTLWNLNVSGNPVSSAKHKSEVLAIEFSPSGRYLVSGGADNTAVVSETTTGNEVLRIPNEDRVEDVAFSPDSSWFATVSADRRIRVWDAASGKERLRMLQDSIINEVKISSNGQWIATTGLDKTVRVWNASTGTEMFQIPLDSSGSTLAFTKDGKYIVAGDDRGEINIWDISVMPVPTTYVQFNGLTGDIQYSPSGEWIAASDDSRVWLLKPENLSTPTNRPQGTPILQFKSNVQKVIFSPDSKWLGIFTNSNEVVIYNIAQKTQKTISLPDILRALTFSSDSLLLITGDSAGNIKTWDVATGLEVDTLAQIDSIATSLAVSSNLLAVGTTDKISIVQLDTGDKLPDIESLGDHRLLIFNADGSLLASSNSSGQIQIWKNESGTFTSLATINRELAYSMAFNPRNDRLAIGTTNYVYLIDSVNGEESARLPLTGAVNGVSFSADGNTLVTSSLRVIQFWDVTKIKNITTDNLVQTACSRLTENLTEAQWSALFGEKPYRLLCENLP